MIFLLSDTGNTRWAAETIAEKTGEKILFIPKILEQAKQDNKDELSFTLENDERLGFCFPVHGWRPPKIVRHFISKLHIETKGHYVYALCTAGDNIGETMDIFHKDLGQQGMQLDAAFSLLMPESYLGLPFFKLDSPKKEKAKKDKAAEELKHYIDAIINHRSEEHLVVGRWPRINSRILGDFFAKHLITDKPFRVDSRRCVRCGICADVCPVHNINGGLGYEPQWKHDGTCLACFACYHHCPHNAINYDHVTQGKGQYFFKKNN